MFSTPRLSLRAVCMRVFLCLVALLALPTISSASAETVVTFTFDDGAKTQNTAKDVLAANGLSGTFFINSGDLTRSNYWMTWKDVDALAAAGMEIAGHTFHHRRLNELPVEEQQHEICDDAATLRNRGYEITSFAYPYGVGTRDPNVHAFLQECGYQVARKVGDLRGPLCLDCPFVQIPPREPLRVYTIESSDGPLSLDILKGYVTATEEHGGGWVPLMFHDICDCGADSITPAEFSAFVAWLKERAASGTVVKTMREAVAGALPVPVPVTPNDTIVPRPTSMTCDDEEQCATGWYNRPVTVRLLPLDYGGSGVLATRYTTNGRTPGTTSARYDEPLTITKPTTLKFRTHDGAGNAEAVQTATLKVDTNNPIAGVLNPLPNRTVSARQALTILAGALDLTSGIASVDFYVDGAKVGTDTTGLYTYTWAKPVLGKHTVKVVATDLAGNTATSSTTSFTVVR